MKIANVVSASVVLALTSLLASVGCSHPTDAAANNDSAAADSTTTAPKKSSTSDATTSKGSTVDTTTAASASSNNAATDAGAAPPAATDGNACDECLATKSPKMAANMQCESSCDGTDPDCINTCWTTNCGTDATNECTQAEDACHTTCQADTQGCDTCITNLNPKAGAYYACLVGCEGSPDSCNDQCMTSSGCGSDDACLTALGSDSCDAQCSQD